MFEWLFPGWSSPATVAATVGVRLLLNAALVGLVARTAGRDAGLTLAAAGATLASTGLMVAVLRPGGPGTAGTYADLLLQAALLAVAGYVAYASPKRTDRIAFAAVALGVVGVALPTVVLYGEATVAP